MAIAAVAAPGWRGDDDVAVVAPGGGVGGYSSGRGTGRVVVAWQL